MSLNDAEIDALEQLQEAIESGDVSLLQKLLNHVRRLVGGQTESGGDVGVAEACTAVRRLL